MPQATICALPLIPYFRSWNSDFESINPETVIYNLSSRHEDPQALVGFDGADVVPLAFV